jgi:hypothetical protein
MAAAAAVAFGDPALPRVNLMPRTEIDRREKKSLVRRWVGAIVAALLFVAVISASALWLQVTAAFGLVAETARTEALLTELAGLSDVRATVDLQAELTDFRRDAMATDLQWSGLVAAVNGVLPPGVVVSGFSLSPGGMPQGEDPAVEIGAGGSIFLTSATPQEIVPLIRAVRPLPGILEADGWQQTSEEGLYEYELRVAFDQSVYTGAYAEEVSE